MRNRKPSADFKRASEFLKATGYVRGSYLNVTDPMAHTRRIEWWLGHGRCVLIHDFREDNLAPSKVQAYTTWPTNAEFVMEDFIEAIMTHEPEEPGQRPR